MFAALAVRYLTKRFIGDYNSDSGKTFIIISQIIRWIWFWLRLKVYFIRLQSPEECNSNNDLRNPGIINFKLFSDVTYHQSLPGNLELEIVDASTPLMTCRDGIILVYSITNRASFQFVADELAKLSTDPAFPPLVLVANKSDLEHLRSVEKTEGVNLAQEFGIKFYELSVAENSPAISQVFNVLISVLGKAPLKRTFSFSRILKRIGKLNARQKQKSDSGSESSFEGSSAASRSTSPKLFKLSPSSAEGGLGFP